LCSFGSSSLLHTHCITVRNGRKEEKKVRKKLSFRWLQRE